MANETESVRQLTSEIEGCISDAEGELLYRLAKDVPEGQAIVEVGRGKDKSTVWLAKGSEAGEKNKVYSIVSHKGSPDHVKVDEENMHTEFIAKLTKARVQDTVVSLHEASEEALRHAFERFGQVASATIIRDKVSRKSRGFGFVEMPNEAEAQAAISGLNRKELKGQQIIVNPARPLSEGLRGGRGRAI